jgi:hypothetical protein
LFVNLLERDYKERYYTGTLGYNPECINTIWHFTDTTPTW